MADLQGAGAVGEIASWVYDDQGRYIKSDRNALVGAVRVEPDRVKPVIGVAAGANKVRAIRAALIGAIINGLGHRRGHGRRYSGHRLSPNAFAVAAEEIA